MSITTVPYKEKIFSLVNQANTVPVPLTEKNLYFGKPRLAVDGVNTLLPTVAVLGEEYEGYVTLQYKRISLNKMFGDIRPILADVGGATLHDMLPAINKYLGLQLTKNDVLNQNTGFVGVGEQVNIDIRADPKSISYSGNFIMRFLRVRPFMNRVILKRELPLLSFPIDPADGKASLSMATWGFDFSDDTQSLLNGWNYWYNLKAVKDLMEIYGFPNWPAPVIDGVSTYQTKNYPTANQNFDYVIIQKDVVVGNYKGDAYFHYNNPVNPV